MPESTALNERLLMRTVCCSVECGLTLPGVERFSER